MNERIKLLAEQAGFENGHQDRNGNSLSGELENFAELIVRKCIDICKDVNRNPYLEDEYQARQIIKNIEKHFGVKE